MAMRVAQELRDGDCVNLGIGILAPVANYIPAGTEVMLQSENGLLGIDEFPDEATADADMTSAGKQIVIAQTGVAIFDSVQPFAMIHSGHVNLTVLGVFEADVAGNIASWMIPGKMVKRMGGAVDLVAGAQNVIVAMTHASKNGESRLLPQCTLPLTGVSCTRRAFTDLALLDIVDGTFVLREMVPGVNPDEVMRKMAGRLIVADDVCEMRFSQEETVTDIAIAAVVHAPVGSFRGAFASLSVVDLGAAVVRSLLGRGQLSAAAVDGLIFDQVLTADCGQNPARRTALRAGLPVDTPAVTVNLACGSGLKVVQQAVQAIRCGDAEIVIAGGQESMSNTPYLMHGVRDGLCFSHASLQDSMILDGLWDAFNDYYMGTTAENLADAFDISRERQDAFAAGFQRKAAAAIIAGRFREEIVSASVPQSEKPPRVVTDDEQPRLETSGQQSAQLRPVSRPADGSVTVGNASSLNDGAAAVLLMRVDKARELRLSVLAHIVSSAVAGIGPSVMGTGPVSACRRALRRTGWMLDEVDPIETNEAFVVQALAVGQLLEWDSEKVNVNDGVIALGHPIGASGCRILASLVHEMQHQGASKGLAALCAGSGQGIAMTLQR